MRVAATRFLTLAGSALFAVSALGGCTVVEKRRPVYVVAPASRPACHPSQYWDGAQCRHKGNGRGARKHDGR